MFCKATLVTVALALVASATPIVRGKIGVAIPLTKRGALTTADGIFDHDKAVLHNIKTHNKYQRALRNLHANSNGSLPNSFKLKPFRNLPGPAGKRDTGAIPLTDQGGDIEWSGNVDIGTPAQKFVIDFDTGSSDLWVPSSSCRSSTCRQKNKYSASASKSSKKQRGDFQIQYGDGSTVSGPMYTDTVTVGNISVSGQFFSPVTTLSNEFSDDPIDGILGLAWPAISNLNQDPFFNSAMSSGAMSEGVFGFKLASSDSELFLGGTNTALYSGDIEYHDIDSSTGFWQATGAQAVVDSKAAVSDFETIIDSGTTIMYGPPDAVQTFYAAIPGSAPFDEEEGFYTFPCGSLPDIGFSWGGETWAISEDNFNFGVADSGSQDCVGALAGQDLGLGDGVWLLGDSFMKNVYTAFSFDQSAVGFAALN